MKRIILAIAVAILSMAGASAQNNPQKRATALLNNVQTDTVIRADFCKIAVHLKNIKADGTAEVSIDIENNSMDYVYIFDKTLTAKQLKKQPYKIRFDKFYPVPKKLRMVEGCSEISRHIILAPDYNQTGIIKTEVFDAVPDDFTIPVYLVRQGKKKVITTCQEIIIKVDVHLDAPGEFIAFKYDVEKLKADVDSLTFCNNPKHEPSLEQQKMKWQEKVNELQGRYAQIIQDNGWSFLSSNRGRMIQKTDIYKRYEDVRAILESINIDNVPVKDCGMHVEEPVRPEHYCAYCSLSLNQILNKLENIYMRISNSDDPDSARQQYAAEVRRIEACAKRRSGYDRYQTRIDKFINRINGE